MQGGYFSGATKFSKNNERTGERAAAAGKSGRVWPAAPSWQCANTQLLHKTPL
jgi:hypothetical protein